MYYTISRAPPCRAIALTLVSEVTPAALLHPASSPLRGSAFGLEGYAASNLRQLRQCATSIWAVHLPDDQEFSILSTASKSGYSTSARLIRCWSTKAWTFCYSSLPFSIRRNHSSALLPRNSISGYCGNLVWQSCLNLNDSQNPIRPLIISHRVRQS